jgi:MFS family permease
MSAWHTILEGFQYVGQTRPIRVFLFLVGILSFAGMPYAVLMPIFADKILQVGARGLGILMGVGGVGALGGALLLASRTNLRGLTLWVAAAMGTFSIAIAGFALSGKLWLSCTMLFISGFAAMIQMGASNTLIQSMVPDHLRGRVMSVYSMMFMGVGPFGAMFAGFAADQVGAPVTLAAGAAVCLAATAVFAWRLPGIRTVTRELILAQQATPGHPVEQTTSTGAEATMEPAPAGN